MRKVLLAMTAVAVCIASVAMANDEEFVSEVEYYRKLAEKQLAEAQAVVEVEPEEEQVTVVTLPPPLPELVEPVYLYKEVVNYVEEPAPPNNAIVAIPQYFHSKNKHAKFEFGGKKLEMAKGTANGAGITLVYNRRISDVFSFAVMYEYGFMKVKSGMPIPEGAGVRAEERSRWHSHVVGLLPEFNFNKFGKLQVSFIQGFDRSSGTEAIYTPNGNDIRDIDDYSTNVTSLMAWYEKDFAIGDSGFKLTPYAGWRSLFVQVDDQNNWDKGPRNWMDDTMWVHLVSGGMKASYQKGLFGFNLRAGVSHRTTSDDIPGYGNRAVAPGVVQFSHRANLDRTVGSFGAGVNFAIKKRAMVGVNYDATVGKDTSSHTATLSFALPF